MKQRYRDLLHAIARLLAREDERPPRDVTEAEGMLTEAEDAPLPPQRVSELAEDNVDRAIADMLDEEPSHSRSTVTAVVAGLLGLAAIAAAVLLFARAWQPPRSVTQLAYEDAVEVAHDVALPALARRSAAEALSRHSAKALEELRALHDDPVLGPELPALLERLRHTMEDPLATPAPRHPVGVLPQLLRGILDRNRDPVERRADLQRLGSTLQSGVGAVQALGRIRSEAAAAEQLLQSLQEALRDAASPDASQPRRV